MLTNEEVKSFDTSIAFKLNECAPERGNGARFTYEECCLLACRLRQREDLLTIAHHATRRLAIALSYIVSLWKCHRNGEVYGSVKFPLPNGVGFVFEYDASVKSVAAWQKSIPLLAGREMTDDE